MTTSSGPVVLGVDLATAGIRVLAVDVTSGAVLASADAALAPPTGDGPGRMEQTPDHLEHTLTAIGRVCARLGTAAAAIVAISVTGTSGSMVPCDRRGRPVGPVLLYADTRAVEQVRLLAEAGAAVPAASALARIGWLARHTGGELFLHTPDLVTTGLAGRVTATDTSHALKAGVDANRQTWPTALLDVLDVPVTSLPELVLPGTELGAVDDAVAARLGLPSGVAIIAGMTDGCTGQIASGAVTAGSAVGVLGTTLVLKAVSDHDVSGFAGAVYSHLAPGGRYLPGGACNTGAGMLAVEFAGEDLSAWDAAAAARGPAGPVRYPLPGTGERFPFTDPAAVDLRSAEPSDRIESYRMILEGVAFTEKLGLERLSSLGVHAVKHRAVGGGSRSTVWTGIRATVLDRPITIPAEPSSGFGAAVLAAAGGAGLGLDRAVTAMVRPARVVDPVPTESDALRRGYHAFRQLLTEHGHLEPVPA